MIKLIDNIRSSEIQPNSFPSFDIYWMKNPEAISKVGSNGLNAYMHSYIVRVS